jgi:hypothetical protein
MWLGMKSVLPQDDVIQNVLKHVSNFCQLHKYPFGIGRKGPVAELGADFVVMELSTTPESNNLWVYCTAGTGVAENDDHRYEFFLVASSPSQRHVETLTMLSHYHRFESRLGLGHTQKCL